ncbi:hypothetical protein ZIOFF_037170 [Zingiber officinale]|uniref:Uncharacterized protein n=1 Tax=Zingiber officinale TaxID=94328 RepID=A0A8J5L3X6_ZINOF|nr:hypothetical protein ZIOFF_037170 [Zingiber officinale]
MVLTGLKEKKIHSDMITRGSQPDAKWTLEFEAKHKTRMDRLEKMVASLVIIVQELKDRLEVDSSSSILIKRGTNHQSRQQQYDHRANSNENQEHNFPRMKVEFLRLENNDPSGCISRAKKYFHFHSTSDNAKFDKRRDQGKNGKGLCWHCDEKWHCGHQCKQKRILMIGPIENSHKEDDFDEGETRDNFNEIQVDSMAIAVHALEGLQTPQMMKIDLVIKDSIFRRSLAQIAVSLDMVNLLCIGLNIDRICLENCARGSGGVNSTGFNCSGWQRFLYAEPPPQIAARPSPSDILDWRNMSLLNLSNLMYLQLDNHQTAGSIRSSDDEKRKLAKASIVKKFIEKYYQRQNVERPVAQQPENNWHPRSTSIEQPFLQDDAARIRQRKPVPFWLVLLLLSVFGIMIALPLLQI